VTDRTVAELVGECLVALGATRVFGSTSSGITGIPGLQHVLVEEPSIATLLADASGRIGSGPGVALLPDRVLRVGSQPGATAERLVIPDVEMLPTALAAAAIGEPFPSLEYRLELDLDAPVPDELGPVDIDPGTAASTLSSDLVDVRTLVLAGPGVVRAGAVAALHEVAERLGCGVVNTWGAKGVYRWDSPYHFGTAGLQERDAELAGLTTAELVITTGLDPRELPVETWASGPVLDVDPRTLAALTYRWEPSRRELGRPALYERLSRALAPLYASDEAPLSPARAAADLGARRPEGGLVAADPGLAGLWVARTLPTVEHGSVIVPALFVRGFALAAAVVAALDGRPSVAVMNAPIDEASAELLALAEHWGVDVAVELWGADAPARTPADRAEALSAAIGAPGVSVVQTPVEFAHTKTLVEAAGAVVAWVPRP
jgi:hypothetical protein